MKTRFAIGQLVWVMLHNNPVKAKIDHIIIRPSKTVEYFLEYQWSKTGMPEKFSRYEKDVGEDMEELKSIIFKV